MEKHGMVRTKVFDSSELVGGDRTSKYAIQEWNHVFEKQVESINRNNGWEKRPELQGAECRRAIHTSMFRNMFW